MGRFSDVTYRLRAYAATFDGASTMYASHPAVLADEAAAAIITLERELEDARVGADMAADNLRTASEQATADLAEMEGEMLRQKRRAIEAGLCVDAFSEICDELGCERDNEAGLQAAYGLITALTASQAEVERLRTLVETAFRDGLTYGTNVVVTDADEAWRTSRVCAALHPQVKP